MSEQIRRLQERRRAVWQQAMDLTDRADAERRFLTAEEDVAYSRMNADIDAFDARIKELHDGEQMSRSTERQFDEIHGANRAARRAIPGGVDYDGHGRPGNDLRAFLRGDAGHSYTVMPSGPFDFRSLVKGTAASGGYTVASGFYDRIVEHMVDSSGILKAGPTVLNTQSGENLMVPKTTAHYAAAIVTEASSIATSESVFGQVTLGAFKYAAMFQCSRELIDDNGVDLEGYLARSAGRALGNAMGNHFVVGTGTTMPSGVVVGATAAVTGATGQNGGPTVDNLIDLHYSVIPAYRSSSSCGWLMSDSTIGKVRKLKDTTGQYLWQPSMQLGAPDTILGKPVYSDPYVATATTGAKSVVFGDFSAYFVRLAGGIRYERSDEFSFDKDLITYRCLARADGALVDLTGALKVFVGNAAV